MPEIELGKRGGIGATRSISVDDWVRGNIKIRSERHTSRIDLEELTVNFLQARLPGNWGICMLVERPPVTTEFELLMDVDFLIAEDCGRISI